LTTPEEIQPLTTQCFILPDKRTHKSHQRWQTVVHCVPKNVCYIYLHNLKSPEPIFVHFWHAMRWKSYDHKVFIISHQTPGLLYFAIFRVAEIRIFTRHSYVHKHTFQ